MDGFKGLATIRVFIADNHPISLEGLASILGTAAGFEVVGTAETVQAAVAGIKKINPDLAILNVSTGGIRTKAITEGVGSTVKILTVSSEVTPDIVLAALQNGAGGFLATTCSRAELTSAAKRVTDGENVLPSGIASMLADGIRRASEGKGPTSDLSQREKQVLSLTAEGYTMKQVGTKLSISPRTVQTHLSNVYTKLDVKDRASAVAKAMKLGILTNV